MRKRLFWLVVALLLPGLAGIVMAARPRPVVIPMEPIAIVVDNADRHLESVLAVPAFVPGVVHQLQAVRIQLQAADEKTQDVIDLYPPDAVVPPETVEAAQNVEDTAAAVVVRAEAGFVACDDCAPAVATLNGVQADAQSIVDKLCCARRSLERGDEMHGP